MGDRRIFLKTRCDTSFNKDLSNEPNFDRIHLAGPYLYSVRNEYSPQLSKLLYNFQLKNKEALQYFEGLSEDVGRADFSKNLPRLSHLMKTYRMSLISSGSISLDSTFF